MSPVIQSLEILRRDAMTRGMYDLAVAYGWSAVRAGQDILEEQCRSVTAMRPPNDQAKKQK